jgi:uncharacterized protein (DUF2141 family)
MKTSVLILFLAISAMATAQVAIKVDIVGLKNNKGQVLIGLYNSENHFLKKVYKGNVALIQNEKATATFENLPAGEYAISIFHDENSNGKLDANFMGIPKEDYAASNDAKGFMGPPKYKDAKFQANQNKHIILKV